MDHQTIHIMTIANSIIGVSILAMPYCFKQCGILLSIVILIVSSIISRLSCHLLLKSAIMARRRTFEFLAFHAFGPLGKFIVEIGLIGFLVGTCIAFFVVMGDLGPAIVVKMTGTKSTDTLRTSILMVLALFCVLPLGLLRNIDSLSSVCTATIGFYFCLVLKIIAQSFPHIFAGDWYNHVELWRPTGFLQCLPIFSMALFCQTQIFEIYQAIPNASLDKMNDLIRKAVTICTGVYIFVGTFGYIAFSGQTFTGNILMSFPTSLMTEVIKIGFVLSVAFSFPLVIFPCRASLYSLLYKQTYSLHEGTDKYIPEGRFKTLTFLIVLVSLITGVMIPNIELVLGLVGSTIGIMVCVLFPAMCFICISTKNTNERILAQIMLFIGVIVMVLGTYANLYTMEQIGVIPTTEKMNRPVDILKSVQKEDAIKVIDIPNTSKPPLIDQEKELKEPEIMKEIRHEPPQPQEPAEPLKFKHKDSNNQPELTTKMVASKKPPPIIEKETENPVLQEPIKLDENNPGNKMEQPKVTPGKQLPQKNIKEEINADKSNLKKAEEVDKEAIAKEEHELLEQEKKLQDEEKKNLDLIKTLEEQNEEQKKLVAEKKKLLEEIKQALEQNKKQKEIDKEESLKAVVQIEEIAKKTIEKLSATEDKQPEILQKAEKDSQSNNIVIDPKLIETSKLKLEKDEHTSTKTNNSLLEKPKIELDKKKLLPLPMALSPLSNNGPPKDIAKMENPIEPTGIVKMKLNETVVKPSETKEIPAAAQINLLDVLKLKTEKKQEDSAKEIQHREIRSVDLRGYSTLENCRENAKVDVVTEVSLVKMIEKLSEPELVSLKLPDVDLVLKPLKRDLKSYKFRKRK